MANRRAETFGDDEYLFNRKNVKFKLLFHGPKWLSGWWFSFHPPFFFVIFIRGTYFCPTVSHPPDLQASGTYSRRSLESITSSTESRCRGSYSDGWRHQVSWKIVVFVSSSKYHKISVNWPLEINRHFAYIYLYPSDCLCVCRSVCLCIYLPIPTYPSIYLDSSESWKVIPIGECYMVIITMH